MKFNLFGLHFEITKPIKCVHCCCKKNGHTMETIDVFTGRVYKKLWCSICNQHFYYRFMGGVEEPRLWTVEDELDIRNHLSRQSKTRKDYE